MLQLLLLACKLCDFNMSANELITIDCLIIGIGDDEKDEEV
jgi:hypothetical protein